MSTMTYERDDILRLAHEIRRFLAKGDLTTRLATMGKLYLEFPDVATMHHVHTNLMVVLAKDLLIEQKTSTYIDDHTLELQIMGVAIILSSKQRFITMKQGSIGYRDIAFRSKPE